jgi:hypothetical protein
MGEGEQPEDGELKGEYQDWCRVQYQMAHHDIWWPKGQQLKAGSSTLLLLGAIVGASKLLWPQRDTPQLGLIMLSVLSVVAVGLGVWYAWNLYKTLVRARDRARRIARLVHDPHEILAGALEEPDRNIEFPLAFTIIHAAALTIVLVYYWK